MAEKIHRTRQITIETHSVTIIRAKGKSFSDYCEKCRIRVAAFTPEQVAAFLQIELNEVYRQIESGEIHLVNTEAVSLVCSGSLDKKNKQS